MKIISIGDVHGSDVWKNINPDNYDKIIFIGDYVDHFTFSDDKICNNLADIISFKKSFTDKVILLLGNHDLWYIYQTGDFNCSGVRQHLSGVLGPLFNDNINLFLAAYEIDSAEHKYIWTHAGIHRGWYDRYIKPYHIDMTLAQTLNKLFKQKYQPLYHCGHIRWGSHKEGGIFWADKKETYPKPLLNYHHIIGHSRQDEIKHYENYGNEFTSTTYIDVQQEPLFYELEIINGIESF